MDEIPAYTAERDFMIESQLVSRGIRDPSVLEAMRAVPRHSFVLPEYRYLAYTDGPLPIGSGQTISQPYIVALMSELLELKENEVVLEIGTGSGYQAAILAHLAKVVHTMERHASLAQAAAELFEQLCLSNIHVHIGDGTLGLTTCAPFDAIAVTAAAPNVPKALFDQLADNGRLVIPVGGRNGQFLERWRRQGKELAYESIIPVAFVPLVGEQGWKD